MTKRIIVTSETTARRKTEFRIHNWINTDTLEPIFGVQVKLAPRQWAHVCQAGTVMLFDYEADAKEKIEEYRRGDTR